MSPTELLRIVLCTTIGMSFGMIIPVLQRERLNGSAIVAVIGLVSFIGYLTIK